MLNIGKMGPGSEDYYLSLTVDRPGNYYLDRGEAPGRWLGRGLDRLGLDGQVDGEQLKQVLAGDHPTSGQRLASHPARKIPGFDLTFRAPKSVSLLWALSDRETADHVLAAHEAAVDAAVGYLEREAARTRRGAGGTERVEVDGFIAAGFGHRTSRAGDPLLHTHVLVANLARTCDDGKWRTLESRRIFLYAKTAGYLYQAQLRQELTTRLGVGWGPVTNGYADIAGVDRQLIEAFSTRRRQILDRLEERGESSAKAAQVATLETRAAKELQPTEVELRARWAEQARRVGHDPRQVADVVGHHVASGPDVDSLVAELVEREGLTEDASTFARRDLLQAVAERLPDGASVAEVDALADSVMETGQEQLVQLSARRGRLSAVDAIRTKEGRIVAGDEVEPRMTTRRLLLAEQHAITTAVTRQRAGVAVVDATTVEAVLAARPTMTSEQAVMLRRLTGDGDGVAVVVGRAGTGKTFTLDAARDAWTRAGIDVHGVALAARAARELQDASGIASQTIHRLLHQLDSGPGSPLRPGSVLVVDEAGMVGTRQLARLLDHAERQRVKVVLVGDPRQLPEIEAGGLFGHLTTRLQPIELTDNRRQQQPWEIAALDQLRHGNPAHALHAYDRHGRVVTADTAETLRERLVSDWWHARDRVGADQAVMIALQQTDIDDLNHRARTRMTAADQLHGPALEVDSREFRAGDRIVCLRNDRRIGVVNGNFATITTIDDNGLQVVDDHGQPRQLTASYVEGGHVAHGYAITGHKAQGLTVDQAFVLGSDVLYREWGYVAMSRGRQANRLYVHAAAHDPHGISHGRQPDADPHQETLAGLRRSAAQDPAVAFLRLDPRQVARLADERRRHASRLHDHDLRQNKLLERWTDLQKQVTAIEADLERLEKRRDELDGVGGWRRTVRAQIVELDHRRDRGRQHLKDAGAELAAVQRHIDSLPSELQVASWRRQLAAVEQHLEQAAETRTRAVVAEPPAYVLGAIGGPPDDESRRQQWLRAVRTVEAYRIRFGINDPTRPLGDAGHDPGQAQQRRAAIKALAAALPRDRELAHDDLPRRGHGIGRSR